MRADDHAIIGALLMGVLVPAVFWNRARAINRVLHYLFRFPILIQKTPFSVVLGGVGFGNDIGLLTYYGQSFTATADSSQKNIPSLS